MLGWVWKRIGLKSKSKPKVLHPRIQQLCDLIRDGYKEKGLHPDVLHLLKKNGASRTEAAITLHLGFGVPAEKADDLTINSNVFPSQDVQDVFYETLKYLQYDPNDPNYKEDGDKITVSI